MYFHIGAGPNTVHILRVSAKAYNYTPNYYSCA